MRATPTPRVTTPVMYHEWSHMTFIHWRYPPDLVQSLLPDGLAVEEHDGSAWVGLTPFLMRNVRVPGVPAIPGVSQFPETNVRTYVRDTQGRSGLWFLSLDAGSLLAVLGARTTYRLPYHWSDMSVAVERERRAYRCRRRWPGPGGVRCDAEVDVGAPLTDSEREERADFLTERYLLFTLIGGRLAHAAADHRSWPLHHARLISLDQDLVQAGGLTTPDHDPILYASPGVRVRVGMWSRT